MKTQTKRTGTWTQVLVTLIFIMIPSILIMAFLSKDFGSKISLSVAATWGIAIGFVSYSFILGLILVLLKIVWIDIYNNILPIAIVLMSLFLTQSLPSWARAIIAISLVITALPVNMITTRLSHK